MMRRRSVALLILCLLAPPLEAQLPGGPWKTDVTKKSIDLSELYLSLDKDEIPSIDHPQFVTVKDASSWISPQEPVLVFEHAGEARAYPLQILLFHELVNDQIGDLPFLVSFCPLCNSGVIFDRRIDGQVYEFGVAGLLRHSDLVMHDRQTESLWQQVTGEAIVGSLTGKRLRVLSSQMVSFGSFAETFSEGKVLSRRTGLFAPYGESHYVNYEFGKRDMLPVRLKRPLPVAPLERVVGVSFEGKTKAYPFSFLQRWRVHQDRIKKNRFVIFFEPGMVSAMDAERIAESRKVGAAGVFSPFVDGERLKFRRKNGQIVDKKTGSTWNVLGHCVAGPLAGKRLEPVPHGVFFAFAWAVFHPNTKFIGAAPESPRPGSPPLGPGRPGRGASAPFPPAPTDPVIR